MLPPEKRGRPLGTIPGAAPDAFEADHAIVITRVPAVAQHLRLCPRFHPLIERLHQLGPRPVGEALLAVASGADLLEVLEEFAQFEPEFVRYLGARHWPPSIWSMAS